MILEKGSHDELMKKRGRYYDMYKTQMERESERLIGMGRNL